MNRPVLLDVNVLIALFDSAHIHHTSAHEWFARNRARNWRSCPITENAFLRILSHSAYPNGAFTATDLSERLEELKRDSKQYEFWSEDFSMSEWIAGSRLTVSSSQSTDAYLLKLCERKRGALATFDQRIQSSLIGEKEPRLVEHLPV